MVAVITHFEYHCAESMCLYKEHLMKLYFLIAVIFSSAYYSYAEEKTDSIKTMIAREIMKKVSNITLNSLSKVPDDKKVVVLDKIERKLLKTAEALPNGEKYVHFIMDEFRNKAFTKEVEVTQENEMSAKIDNQNNMTNIFRNSKSYVDIPVVEKLDDVVPRKIFDSQTKERLINDIAQKIEAVAKGYLRRSQTLDQKEKILQKIRDKIIETSKRKHMQIHNEHNELKAYSDLIAKGFELSMIRLLNTKIRRKDDAADVPIIVDDSPILTNVENATVDGKTIVEHINQYKTIFSEIWNDTFVNPGCEETTAEICLRLGSLHKINCGDGQAVSLLKLCDGVSDCWNEGDEINCTDQAISKVKTAISLMMEIDEVIPEKCIHKAERPILSYHHQELRTMLETQLRYIDRYTPPNTKQLPVDDHFDMLFRKTSISDVRMAITTLSHTLEANLCASHHTSQEENLFSDTRRFLSFDAIRNDLLNASEKDWSPKVCSCKHQYCKMDNCDPRCERVCYQKYSLNHWECEGIGGDTTIHLDLICDGKLDCFDETDETSCTTVSSYTKYEANNLYKELLDLLSLKSLSMEYGPSRNKIASQLAIVRQLQKLTTKQDVDIHSVRALRNDFFKLLVQIYVDLIQTSHRNELDHAYDFLLMLNQKMIGALKLSHSGNKNHLSPVGCYCHNGTCAIIRCSKKCTVTCQIEPLLTKFVCSDNSTVHLKSVCNGKKDCLNNEDEKNCSKEVCRSHHLLVLRNNLKNIGLSVRGTMLGEALEKWRTKVIASLVVAQEANARPVHKKIEDITIMLLRELVTSYASVDESRRINTDVIVREYRNVSEIVKQTLKSCGN